MAYIGGYGSPGTNVYAAALTGGQPPPVYAQPQGVPYDIWNQTYNVFPGRGLGFSPQPAPWFPQANAAPQQDAPKTNWVGSIATALGIAGAGGFNLPSILGGLASLIGNTLFH